MKASNWSKFSVVAGLGVIHKGHTAEAMNVLAPYLPKDGSAGNPYEAGGSLYALGTPDDKLKKQKTKKISGHQQ